MVDRFKRGRHDAVIRRDHEHNDIGNVGAARTHGGESLVTGRIQKSDELWLPRFTV